MNNSIKCKVKRKSNYDLLRIVSVIAVIAIHVSAFYTAEIEHVLLTKNTSSEKIAVIMWNTLTRFCIPSFVMLSGAFILANDENADYKKFYNKGFKRLVIPTLVFSILYFVYSIIWDMRRILIKEQVTEYILEYLNNFLLGKPYYHMWYLFLLIGVYILVPIVIRFKNSISEKRFSQISWIFLVIGCASYWTSSYTIQWDIGLCFEFLGYVMIGYEIRRKCEKTSSNNFKAVLFILLGLLVEFILVIIKYNNMIPKITKRYDITADYAPGVAIAAVLIFIGFSKLKIKRDFSKLSSLTLYIYLFHAGVLDYILRTSKIFNILTASDDCIIIIPVLISVIFIVCYILSIIYTKIWNLINKENRIYKKIDEVFEKI